MRSLFVRQFLLTISQISAGSLLESYLEIRRERINERFFEALNQINAAIGE